MELTEKQIKEYIAASETIEKMWRQTLDELDTDACQGMLQFTGPAIKSSAKDVEVLQKNLRPEDIGRFANTLANFVGYCSLSTYFTNRVVNEASQPKE